MSYQLFKTTPYLSGQHQIDLEVKPNNGALEVYDLHIVPISDKVVFNESGKRISLNYKHNENIKHLYDLTSDTFFDALQEKASVLTYSDRKIDTIDHTYQYGLKRIAYQRYNKQFSMFVPLWINNIDDIKNIEFRIYIKNRDNHKNIGYKRIVLSDAIKAYFVEYFNNINDEVFNINLQKEEGNQAFIKGLNAEFGVDAIKNVSYIVDNLLSRERPLMEFDSILCNTFSQNHIIAKQLINFNIIFDFDDIIDLYNINNILFKKFEVACDVGANIDGEFKKFDKKDIYTNYDFIPAYILNGYGGNFSDNKNTLDYLSDNKCIDFIYNNKAVQPLCHWTLVDNPGYVFNLYNGFSPIYNNTQISGSYYGTPVLKSETYNGALNTLGWCNVFRNLDPTEVRHEISLNINNIKHTFTKVNKVSKDTKDTQWIDWLKYNTIDIANFTNAPDVFYVSLCANDNQTYWSNINNSIQIGNTSIKYIYNENGYLVLEVLKDNIDLFTIKALRNKTASGSDNIVINIVKYLIELFNNVIVPNEFKFYRSVTPKRANGPIAYTDEISYYKADFNVYAELYRYTGHLMPMFIDTNDNNTLFNTEWYAKQFSDASDDSIKKYNENIHTGYDDVYPSIDYFALDKVSWEDQYNTIRYSTIYSQLPDYYINNIQEMNFSDACWFDHSVGMHLDSSIVINATSNDVPNIENKSDQEIAKFLFKNYIKTNFRIEGNLADIIFKKYRYSVIVDYLSNTDVSKYKFTITYILA